MSLLQNSIFVDLFNQLYIKYPITSAQITMVVEQITYKNIDPKVRRSIMVGLCLAMLCACFDGTIIGTCGTKIANELHGDGLFAGGGDHRRMEG